MKLKHPVICFSIAYALLIVVAVVSLIPMPDTGVNDKSMHFITYFGLSAGFTTLVENNKSLWVVTLGLIAYGAVLEVLQSMTGYRYMELYDLVANSIGVISGLLVRLTPIPNWFRSLESRL